MSWLSSDEKAKRGKRRGRVFKSPHRHFMIMLNKIVSELNSLKDKEQKKILERFFKTGKGEYGQGDVFLGIRVPVQRKIVKKYDLSFQDIQKLMDSKIHEHRFTGLLLLMKKYNKNKKKCFDFYLKNTKNINNWDLVDVSAPNIVGDYLFDKDRKILYKLAESGLWERRIAIVSTLYFIRKNDFKDSLQLCEKLVYDEHDLINKAVGWMLREMGKRDEKQLKKFLDKYCKTMPRVTLRYSIERLSENQRKHYLSK